MFLQIDNTEITGTDAAIFSRRLKKIFSGMDATYDEIAASYGFNCTGCEDSCCLTRFHHHTVLEYIYVAEGFSRLDDKKKEESLEKAEAVVREYKEADLAGATPRAMCPLNSEGLCTIYEHRPMICRMHGLPHELRPPGRQTVRSPGCDLFYETTGDRDYIPFDRTPFYSELAQTERDLRLKLNFNGRIKMTISEMILILR